MALQFYLEIPGINGDCQDADHKNHFDVSDWNTGLHHPSNVKQGGSTATGKTTFSDMSVVTHLDNGAPDLFGKVSSGGHIDKATLKCYKGAADARVNYLNVKLEDLVVSGFNVHASGERPTAQYSFNFAKMTIEYKTQDRKNKGSAPATGSWDVSKNTP